MSAPIDLQLRDYTEFFEAQLPDIDLEDVLTEKMGAAPVRPLRPRHVQRRRPWLVAVAAAAAVLVLVGGVVLLLRVTGSEKPVATTLPTEPASLSAWSRVPNEEAVFGGEGGQVMNSVTVGGPGLVAVGVTDTIAGEAFPDGYAAVWTSPDGVTWSRRHGVRSAFHSAATFGEGHTRLLSVTAGGPGLVVVGSDALAAAVWTSPDGVTWSRVPHDEAVFGAVIGPDRGRWMSGVTVGGPGLVAVGAADTSAAVWTSPDGVTWSRVPDNEAVFGGEGHQVMWSVTVGGPGLVAVGSDGSDGAVWTSVDGVTWSRVPLDEAVFGGAGTTSLTAGGPGLVAVGSVESDGSGDDEDAAVWTSVDGVTWSRVPHDEDVFGGEGGQVMESVTAGGQGLVAVGSDWEGAAVWTSPDGTTWSRVPDDNAIFDAARISSVTLRGPGVVAVGDENGNPAVWNASTED